jgi:hypothetical protein
VAVGAVLSDGAVGVRATGEETHLVFTGHVLGTIGVASTPQCTHASTAVRSFGAAETARAVGVDSASSSWSSRARCRLEAATRVRVGGTHPVVVIATTERKQHEKATEHAEVAGTATKRIPRGVLLFAHDFTSETIEDDGFAPQRN